MVAVIIGSALHAGVSTLHPRLHFSLPSFLLWSIHFAVAHCLPAVPCYEAAGVSLVQDLVVAPLLLLSCSVGGCSCC
jgi:hypothetical protein